MSNRPSEDIITGIERDIDECLTTCIHQVTAGATTIYNTISSLLSYCERNEEPNIKREEDAPFVINMDNDIINSIEEHNDSILKIEHSIQNIISNQQQINNKIINIEKNISNHEDINIRINKIENTIHDNEEKGWVIA